MPPCSAKLVFDLYFHNQFRCAFYEKLYYFARLDRMCLPSKYSTPTTESSSHEGPGQVAVDLE